MTDHSVKRKLNLCLVGPAYPYRGGISHYHTCLARELKKRHQVRVINYSRLYPEFLFPGKTQYDESSRSLAVESDRMIDSLNPFTWVRAGFHIASTRPDLVLFQWWHPFFAPALSKIGGILRILRRGRIIFICHNVIPHESFPLAGTLSRLAFSMAHGYIVQSGEDRDNLLELKRDARLELNPHPIYDFFRSGEITREEAKREIGAGEEPLLLFFGYIRPYKGLEYLIRAMPRISRETGAKLMVVGEFYQDQSSYRDLVDELDLNNMVSFVDRYVGNEEVERYFVASNLVVLPYLSATQSGIAQIAIAFNRPVVVTRVGGLPEVVREGRTGFVVSPASSRELEEAVIKYLSEGWEEKMKPDFEEEKERFSWSHMADTVEKLYYRIGEGE